MSLFDSNKPISPQASGRIQRWALKLATYEYTLRFRTTNQHANADGLRRLPLTEKPERVPIPAEHVLLIEHLSETPLSAAQLKIWTAKDPLLAQVLQYIRSCMDREIEEAVKHCAECQQAQPSPPAAPLHPWQWPTRPWARIHIDFAGPLDNRMYLIIVDAHSKWIEAFPMTSTTATKTIQILRTTFARFGIPDCFGQWSPVYFIRSSAVLQNKRN